MSNGIVSIFPATPRLQSLDSIGTTLQDIAAAAAVYRRALEHGARNHSSINA